MNIYGVRRSAPLLTAAIASLIHIMLVATTAIAADLPAGYKLLHEETFDKDSSLTHFQMTDPTAWKWISTNDNHGGTMELVQQSKYKPAVRSPVNIALIKDKVFGDFILEADLIQTGKEYGHRDMCLFFGFQSPTNFYYAHMATAADPNAHNIFIVNGAPRKNFAKETTKGVAWGLGLWHHVKLERTTSDGMIKVYFDDMNKPIMTAQDSAFKSGAIGFGSFDDTGRVDNIKIWGTAAEMKPLPPFPKEQ
jgi:hypothetical protein